MLSIEAIGKWVINAFMWSVLLCLIYFNVVRESFRDMSIFEMGTVIYVGLVLSLQLKVGFIHHLWNRIHFISMAISIIALFIVLLILSASSSFAYDYYYVVNKLYVEGIFWFFGFFSGPLICILLDFIGQSYYVFFAPSDEMVFREAARFKLGLIS